MKKWILTLSFLVSYEGWSQSVCSPLLNYCSYYTCASRTLACKSSGYLESFGQKYCGRFEDREQNFSSRGKRFLAKVSLCLRNDIEENFNKLNCSNVKPIAADSHVKCYVSLGFCNLSFMDQYRIFQTVLKPVLTDRTFQKVAFRISRKCN